MIWLIRHCKQNFKCHTHSHSNMNMVDLLPEMILHDGKTKELYCSVLKRQYEAEFKLKCFQFFIAFSHAHFRFWGHERVTNRSILTRHPMSAAPWVEKVQLQERFTLMTHDAIGHMKTPCMSILFVCGDIEFEWKCYGSQLSVEKR